MKFPLSWALVAIVPSTFLGGCSGSSDTAPLSRGMASQEEVPLAASPYLSGVREVHWGETDPTDGRSYRLTLQLSEPAQCDFADAFAGQNDVQGYRNALFLQHDRGYFSSVSYGSEALIVSAGPVDTVDEEQGTGGEYRSIGRISNYDLEGVAVITYLSRSNSPASTGVAAGYSFAFSVQCDQPFDILEAKMGDFAALSGPINLDGTVIAVAATASVASGTAHASIPLADGGVFVLAASQVNAGTVAVRHPAGEEQYLVFRGSLDTLREFAFGAGEYEAEVLRAGALPDTLLVAAYGFDRQLDMSGLLDRTPIE